MNDGNEDLNQTDEEILRDEVSDEAVESAFVALGGLPTLMSGSYCFTCRPAIGGQATHPRPGQADRDRLAPLTAGRALGETPKRRP